MSDGYLDDANPYGITLYPVTTPSGAELNLVTSEEADWYDKRRDEYLSHYKLSSISDLQDLDRLLVLEIMVHRWSLWLSQGFDYMYARVDETQLKSNLQGYSAELRALKASLGIDKVSRDKDKGSNNLAEYLQNLLERAREFGYHRNNQYEQAVGKIYELRSIVMTYDRCDAAERKDLDLSPESILDWIRTNLVAEWDELDVAFRAQQKMWIREIQ